MRSQLKFRRPYDGLLYIFIMLSGRIIRKKYCFITDKCAACVGRSEGQDKMAVHLQTTIDIYKFIFCMKIVEFWSNFNNIPPKFVHNGPIYNKAALLQILAGTEEAPSHYLNQWLRG